MAAFEEIDVHGLTKTEAITAIERRLSGFGNEVFTLKVIHGYRGGTALQTAVRKHFAHHPKILRVELGMNPGETDLILR